jgi:hypothetical protein
LHGTYRSYFQDGKPYLECNYTGGLRNGIFKTWFANGMLELDANYYDNVRDMNWKYYNEQGEPLYTLRFKLGKLLNPEVQDSINRVKFGMFNTKEANIPDPEKFMQNPEEYMRLMQVK